MSTFTPNENLIKPGLNERFDLNAHWNQNTDKIDTALGSRSSIMGIRIDTRSNGSQNSRLCTFNIGTSGGNSASLFIILFHRAVGVRLIEIQLTNRAVSGILIHGSSHLGTATFYSKTTVGGTDLGNVPTQIEIGMRTTNWAYSRYKVVAMNEGEGGWRHTMHGGQNLDTYSDGTDITTGEIITPTLLFMSNIAATTNALGGVSLISNTQMATPPVPATSTGVSGRVYPIQLNSNNQMVVNVPWAGGGGDTSETFVHMGWVRGSIYAPESNALIYDHPYFQNPETIYWLGTARSSSPDMPISQSEYSWSRFQPNGEQYTNIDINNSTTASFTAVDGRGNTRSGIGAGRNLRFGDSNTLYGRNVMENVERGSFNTVIGKNACKNAYSENHDDGFGSFSGNTVIGFESGLHLSGTGNFIGGRRAGGGRPFSEDESQTHEGLEGTHESLPFYLNECVILGDYSLSSLMEDQSLYATTVIGAHAGSPPQHDSWTIGNHCTLIGHQSGSWLDDTKEDQWENVTCLGANSTATGSNQVVLGDGNADTYVKGGSVHEICDLRDKTNIRPLSFNSLEFTLKNEPCEFNWDLRERYKETLELDFEQYNYRGLNPEYKKTFTEVEDKERTKIDGIRRTKFIRNQLGVKDGSKAGKRYHQGLVAQKVKAVADSMDFDFAGFQDHSLNKGGDIKSLSWTHFIPVLMDNVQQIIKLLVKIPGASKVPEINELIEIVQQADEFKKTVADIEEKETVKMFKTKWYKRGSKKVNGKIHPRTKADLSLKEYNAEIDAIWNERYGEGYGAHLYTCPHCGKRFIGEAFMPVIRLHNNEFDEYSEYFNFDSKECRDIFITGLSTDKIKALITGLENYIDNPACGIFDELNAELELINKELERRAINE